MNISICLTCATYKSASIFVEDHYNSKPKSEIRTKSFCFSYISFNAPGWRFFSGSGHSYQETASILLSIAAKSAASSSQPSRRGAKHYRLYCVYHFRHQWHCYVHFLNWKGMYLYKKPNWTVTVILFESFGACPHFD
jgi:hypothetical protein